MKNNMKIVISLFLVLSGIWGVYTKTAFAESWERISSLPSIGRVDLFRAAPGDPAHWLISQNGSLYESRDQGKNWKQTLHLGTQAQMNKIEFFDRQIFLLTSQGLFRRRNDKKNWEQVLRSEHGAHSLARDPLNPNLFYLGTEKGLFRSQDEGQTWHGETNELGRASISEIKTDYENGELFVITQKGLYRIWSKNNRLDLVFPSRTSLMIDVTELENLSEESETEEQMASDIYSVAVSYDEEPLLAIGTKNGVFVSRDEGQSWQALPRAGFKKDEISKLVFSLVHGSWIAATERGIYLYDVLMKHWKELSEGFPATQIYDLELIRAEREMLYASTADGLFRMILLPKMERAEITITPNTPQNLFLLAHLFKLEPSISEIQKQAVRYANVSNWKIKRWQWASRVRSLIPSFSVGKSFSEGDNVDIDRGSTTEPDVYIFGPKDRDKNWNFDLDWELSDLVWNSAQTSIDSRDKLMVELRDDILNQVTRLYFERRRAQSEFIVHPPQDILEQMNGLLRIDELTANIDALTDGFLSRKLVSVYIKHPEFKTLWETGDGSV